jgi:hypothetical protein
MSDWREETLDRVRTLMRAADPAIVEERKWRKPSNMAGVPVWSKDGIISTGEKYKEYVKLSFMYGAKIKDPAKLFNDGFAGGSRRAINIKPGDKINERAFKALVKAAVAHNEKNAKPKKKAAR